MHSSRIFIYVLRYLFLSVWRIHTSSHDLDHLRNVLTARIALYIALLLIDCWHVLQVFLSSPTNAVFGSVSR